MLKFLATLVLATLGASAALAQEAPASVHAEREAEAEIAAILQDYARATNELDLDLAEEIWSQEPGVSFIHPRGHQRGWPEIRQNFYVDTMGRLPTRRLEIGDFEVHVLADDAAWCDFYWTFEASLPDGTPINSAGRETQIYKREDGVWQIHHVHYSGMPTQEEGEGF